MMSQSYFTESTSQMGNNKKKRLVIPEGELNTVEVAASSKAKIHNPAGGQGNRTFPLLAPASAHLSSFDSYDL
jgi:hypothetical protein